MGKENEERTQNGAASEGATPPANQQQQSAAKSETNQQQASSAAGGSSGNAAAPADAGGASGASSRKSVRLEADDDIPENAELFEMSSKALAKRLQRHTSKELKERFGTADVGEIKKKLDRLSELESKEEERKRAEMSERERLETDLKKERQLRLDAEKRALKLHENQVISKEEQRITRIAEKYVDTDPDTLEIVFRRLGKHLKTEYTEEQLKTLKNSELDSWFKEYADKHPKHAKASAGGSHESRGNGESKSEKNGEKGETKKEVKVVPHNNKAAAGARPDPKGSSGQSAGRNYSPSSPNAMSRAEAREEAKKEGYSW